MAFEIKIGLTGFWGGVKRLYLDAPNVAYLGEFDFGLDEPHGPSGEMPFDCSTW